MNNKRNSPVTTFIVGVVFIISSWMIYTNFSVPMVEEANVSETWPTTTGIITNSDIRQSESDGTTMYAAVINYDFTVDNKSYSGDRITLTSGNSSTSSIREVKKDLQAYPTGANVKVYYDPELPNNAILEPGADFFTKIIKYAPFLLGFIGLLMIWQLIKKIGLVILALFIGARG
ncbi:DUF3592 domain-containing protein [Ancylomarina sp. 16SWW S1-10-2]|uniref:DUF3592 domain-containing protein n=1 Tax=Ancylomarina sp. 16SWW S1-10-2 TaxID=2499681 RepID=UPI0012AD8455|nr:DUF3592 domain-containing protein [Ancylomarina sp. 16SWW S1-10-2]MRT93133.1 DUF3592 domain-containing protein [Ancylomarina sp. 16SWW S1-10-2]